MKSCRQAKEITHPSKRGVGIAIVGVADVPAVIGRGGSSSQVDRRNAVIEVALDVHTVVLVESKWLSVGVTRVEQRHSDVGAWVRLQGESRWVGRASGW